MSARPIGERKGRALSTTLTKVVRLSSGSRAIERWVETSDQLLCESHLVVSSLNPALRERFGLELTKHYRHMPMVESVAIAGSVVHSLEDLCHQLERALPAAWQAEPIERSIEGPGGIVERLRERMSEPGLPASRHRYYLWRDADVLLRHDRVLFAQLVSAIMGVAAEAEYTGEDLLMVHRLILVGGPDLLAYAEELNGALQQWQDHPARASKPLWKVLSGLERPPVARLVLS
jgi:hypothetical protein